MEVYGLYGQKIVWEVQREGPNRIKHADLRSLFIYKRETLHLFEVYADEALKDTHAPAKKETVKELVGQVLQPILQDYMQAQTLNPKP